MLVRHQRASRQSRSGRRAGDGGVTFPPRRLRALHRRPMGRAGQRALRRRQPRHREGDRDGARCERGAGPAGGRRGEGRFRHRPVAHDRARGTRPMPATAQRCAAGQKRGDLRPGAGRVGLFGKRAADSRRRSGVHGRSRRGARHGARRGADGCVGCRGHHAVALRTARCGGGYDAVELPAHPQCHEAGCGAGGRKYASAQAVAADAAGRTGVGTNHRRGHRHPSRGSSTSSRRPASRPAGA